ncbi:hypothetical protein GC173_10660 [bacterium]|nr:hypothetical protein [bacterium]
MASLLVSVILVGLAAYAGVGVVVALGLLLRILPQRDDALKGAGILVKVVLLPGAAVLWPLLIRHKPHRETPAEDRPGVAPGLRRAHMSAWMFIVVIVPVALVGGLLLRPAPMSNGGPLPEAIRRPVRLPVVVSVERQRFAKEGLAFEIRSDRFHWAHQVEITAARELPIADAVAYYMPAGEAPQPVYLGKVTGPGVFRFPLRPSFFGELGSVVVFSASSGTILGEGA